MISSEAYDQNEYEKEPLKTKTELFSLAFTDADSYSKTDMAYFRLNKIISEQSFESLGFREGNEYEFFELMDRESQQNYYLDGAYYLYLQLKSDILVHKRSIYTFWELLGDVGGLLEILKLLASPIIFLANVSFGSGLNAYLTK